ncbi:MAG: hypothetical protein JJU00_06860 [Opitutales bacterium]|nr:hypothetical protein [Opitutales bacterium]
MNIFRRVSFFAAGVLLSAAGLPAVDIGDELDGFGHDFQTPEGTMNLRIVDNRFRAYFVDEERLVVEPPYIRIVLFTEEMRRVDRRDRLVLVPASGDPYATNPRIIPPPHDFWVRTVLVKSEDDEEHDAVARTLFRQASGDDDLGDVEPAELPAAPGGGPTQF